MVVSFRDRKRWSRLRRRIREAERRVNKAIINRIEEIKKDPVLMAEIEEQADADVVVMGSRGEYVVSTLASLKKSKKQ